GAGFFHRVEDDGIVFWRNNGLSAIELETDTHPGFMTDWQQPFTILLTQAEGVSVVHETVYENRFGYVEDLNFMGANIKVFSKCLGELNCRFNGEGHPHSAVISGLTSLAGRGLKVLDLRAGMAHLIAALIAQGESTIEGVEEIDRGYENIDGRLKELGAEIKRI
ncbi:MAG: UDP-N-acetylglucosamine 1-carboxyvinyltransferase, partial [Patescibacteria group bacterium]|nr:UDP-N-acetylglucosamine 1-carboxyvinyltransferase [Patescibacteria group bacterium]